MSTQPTPGALSAATSLKAYLNDYAEKNGFRKIDAFPVNGVCSVIDREAVKPATAELLEACKILQKRLELGAETHDESVRSLVTDSEIYRWFSSVIAKHEGRTMSTPPTVPLVHDSDRKAVEEIFNKFSVGVFSIFCDDEPDFDQAEQSELVLIIARHHAEERAAVEKAEAALSDMIACGQFCVDIIHHCADPKNEKPFSWKDVALQMYAAFHKLPEARRALTALRTASQSPTEGKT